MPTLSSLALGLAQALLLLALAPLVVGVNRVVGAKLQCRRGPGLLREYADILNFFKRQEIIPLGAGRVFLYVPYVLLATLLLVATGLPILTTAAPVPAVGNIVALLYLLALARFAFALSGIDSGNPFGMTGSSRELTMGVLVEPTMLLALVVGGLLARSTDLGAIAAAFASWTIPATGAGVMAIAAFAVACYFELGKAPFDMAEAEQELQEGPLIEYAGVGLGLFKLGLGYRQLLLLALFIGVFLPFGAAREPSPPALALAAVAFAAKLLVVSLLVALISNSTARARFLFVSRSTWAGFAVALLALILYAVQI